MEMNWFDAAIQTTQPEWLWLIWLEYGHNKRIHNRNRIRANIAKRVANGQCRSCILPHVEGKQSCEFHLEYNKAAAHACYNKKRSSRLGD